jgi:hypothetical protein
MILSWNFVINIPEAHKKQGKGPRDILERTGKNCWRWSYERRNWEHVRRLQD